MDSKHIANHFMSSIFTSSPNADTMIINVHSRGDQFI